MRNLVIATCCAALFGIGSAASAQTTAPTAQTSMKTHHNPMNANARMKKKHMKKSEDSTKDSMSKDSAPKADTSKDGMKKDSTAK